MKFLNVVRKNAYFDSVTLMGVSKRLLDLPGVEAVSVSMGTEMNKQLLAEGGFDAETVKDAGPNDLMILCAFDDSCEEDEMLAQVERSMERTDEAHDAADFRPRTLAEGKRRVDANIAVVSLPGEYAAGEARKALDGGMHVMLFSDNVSVEDEAALKELAHAKGLFVMGPDCGTSIIDGVALCFANNVRLGPVGIVAASGTGAQEVSVLLDGAGLGTSQLIGTGGRDLSAEVGGRMFLDALDALEADEGTEYLLLVSKPPHPSVMPVVAERLARLSKPAVACFLGATELVGAGSVVLASGLEDAVAKTAALAGESFEVLPALAVPDRPSGTYLRGLFCGGTLMEEAKQVAVAALGEGVVRSNAAKSGSVALADARKSEGHTLLDMGDDVFTRGKPHPMIDPSVRNARIVEEARDPETAVILLDFVLGYGAHEDPAGAAVPAIREARATAQREGRTVAFVAYVLGTDEDPQGKAAQRALLEGEGVHVCQTNAQAARLAVSMVKE